jgi:predicted AlkP superfamily pyrophosphatase or phosphodiesterase
MILSVRLALLALFALIASPALAADETQPPVTILVSIDAFRADYLDRGLTPNLKAIAADGIRAVLRPSFPTKTFPNHYAMVTGLRPDRNGIVSNKMEDAARPGVLFTTKNAGDAFWWGQAEPLWAAAEKAGIPSAAFFYPGSWVDYQGTRPHESLPYAEAIKDPQRVTAVIDWLRRPPETRPRFIALYLDSIDHAGHKSGPDTPALDAALVEIDAQIARLRAAIAEQGLAANLVVVSDHGMAAISTDRIVWLHEIADPADYRLIEDGAVAMIAAQPGHDRALAASLLRRRPHVDCRRKSAMPARYHYGRNPRVTPFVCVAEVGWVVMDALPKWGLDHGTHGYDNRAPEMQAIFLAEGPAIRPRGQLPTFDNVDVYPLLRDLLGLPPRPGIDGSDAPFRRALKR